MNPVCYLMDTRAAGPTMLSPFAEPPISRRPCLPRYAPTPLASKQNVAWSGGKRSRSRRTNQRGVDDVQLRILRAEAPCCLLGGRVGRLPWRERGGKSATVCPGRAGQDGHCPPLTSHRADAPRWMPVAGSDAAGTREGWPNEKPLAGFDPARGSLRSASSPSCANVARWRAAGSDSNGARAERGNCDKSWITRYAAAPRHRHHHGSFPCGAAADPPDCFGGEARVSFR